MNSERQDVLLRRMRYGQDDGLDPLDAPPLHDVSPIPNYVQFTKLQVQEEEGAGGADPVVKEKATSLRLSETNHTLPSEDNKNVSILIARYGNDRALSRGPSPAFNYRPPPMMTRASMTQSPNQSRVSSLIARFEVTAREIIEEADKQQLNTGEVPCVTRTELSRSDTTTTRVHHALAVTNDRPTTRDDDMVDQTLAMTKESKIRSLLFCGAVPLPHMQNPQPRDDQESPIREERPIVQKQYTSFFACGGGANDTMSYDDIKEYKTEYDINTHSTQMSTLPQEEGTDNSNAFLKRSPTRSPTSLRVTKHPKDVTVMEMNELSPISRETLRDVQTSPLIDTDDHATSSEVHPAIEDGTSRRNKVAVQERNNEKTIVKARSFDWFGLDDDDLFLDDMTDNDNFEQGKGHQDESALLKAHENKTRKPRDRYASPTDQHFMVMDESKVILDRAQHEMRRDLSDSCLSPNGPIFLEFGSEGLELVINEHQGRENHMDRCVSPSIQVRREEPASPPLISSPTSAKRLVLENAEKDWDSVIHQVSSSRSGRLHRNIPVEETLSDSAFFVTEGKTSAGNALGEPQEKQT